MGPFWQNGCSCCVSSLQHPGVGLRKLPKLFRVPEMGASACVCTQSKTCVQHAACYDEEKAQTHQTQATEGNLSAECCVLLRIVGIFVPPLVAPPVWVFHVCISSEQVFIQSRKCAINNFWTKNSARRLGWGSRGSRQIIYGRIFPIIWSVFGTANRPNINNFRGRRPA